jgi:hypothetical protein
MGKRCLGIVASGDSATVVDAEISDNDEDPIVILQDGNWRLQKGSKASAYAVLHQTCADYIREQKIDLVVVKASAAPQGAARLALLTSAEVRGVILAACAFNRTCEVKEITAGVISRTYGERKIAEYLKDDDFWAEKVEGGTLRKTSREAAMLLVATRNN